MGSFITWSFGMTITHLIISKLEQGIHWVTSRREHKDKRSTAVGVIKGLGQIEWRRLDELLPRLLHYEILYGRNNLQRNSTQWYSGT